MAAAKPCDRCSQPSIIQVRYAGIRLCAAHLHEFVERRVKKEVKRQGSIPAGRIAVATSGGKDSTVALHLTHLIAGANPNVEIVALTIDEGIESYRPSGVAAAQATAKSLGIRHEVRRIKDFAGVTMDEVHEREAGLGQCSFCGVFRRRLMNDFAKEIGATAVVTGHNLDDTAQAILMNLTSADLDKLAKLGPHATRQPGLVPRLLPLRTIPESEIYLYALTKGYTWHDDECPYAEGALRGVYRDMLYKLEEARPGTRHALLRTHEALRPGLEATPKVAIQECVRCGEPASALLCKACEMRQQLLRPASVT